jgi:hypothetical protein
LQDITGPFMEVQIIFWAIGGVWVLALTLAEMASRRDALSWLLGLWVLGTFLFTAFLNWITNGRSLLPMAPAVAILLVRRLERNVLAGRQNWPRGVMLCLAAGAVLAQLTARADFQLADAVRQSARQVWAKYGQTTTRLWFQGHWGFQYYLEALGALPLDMKDSVVAPGERLAIPRNNSNLLPFDRFLPPSQEAIRREVLMVPGPAWLATCNGTVGAGFYASVWGPLPFVFGRVPPESVAVYDFVSRPPSPAK